MPQAYATDADLLAIAPELAVLDSAYRVEWLTLGECEINLSQWGDKARDAHRLLVAHWLTESPALAAAAGAGAGSTGAGGALSAVSVGPASVSWAQSPTVDDTGSNYQTTMYGRRFANMMISTRPLPRIAFRRWC